MEITLNLKTCTVLLAVASLAACSDRQPAAETAVSPAAAETPAANPPAPAPASDTSADPAPTPPASTDTAQLEAGYLGRWTGVEGMYLEVASKAGGGVGLDMQWDLDNKGMFDGSVTAEGLRFMRNGVAETAVHTNGDATGLKNLAGKQDCLTVKPGEGYCRD